MIMHTFHKSFTHVTSLYVTDPCEVKPEGYRPSKTIQNEKAYKMLGETMTFEEAKQACQNDGAVLAMPKTQSDMIDMKEFDCKNCA